MPPTLCEQGVKYYLRASLKEYHKMREKYTNHIFNISMFALFVIGTGIFLFVRYKGKLTPEEISEKERQKQEYIISKLQKLSAIKQNKNMITGLPLHYGV